LEAVLADLLDILLGDDPTRARGRRTVERHEIRPRVLQAEAHAHRIHYVDRDDAVLEKRRGRTPIPVEAELDVLGRDRVTVVKADAVSEYELVDEAIGRAGP